VNANTNRNTKNTENSPCWVVSAPGVPFGARILGMDYRSDRIWVDVCLMGQHLPQMYAEEHVHGLGRGHCKVLGLCEECLGFGDTDTSISGDMLHAARSIDEVVNPCKNCGGTGRTAMRVRLARGFGQMAAEMSFLPHEYVKPLNNEDDVFYQEMRELFGSASDLCLACGLARGEKYQGEEIHVEAAPAPAPSTPS